jgi:hypothetical protein
MTDDAPPDDNINGDNVTFENYDPRREFILAEWLTLDLPERDYLLGNTICSTSRWLMFGNTGVGKTLFAMGMGAAIATGLPFLNWLGRRPARVLYLDGELPAETFKERMQLVAKATGSADVPFYGYSRDVLGPDDMPPLNTEPGQKWLLREIDLVKPDIIFFDAIMSLLIGTMSEEESWAPMKPFVRLLSAKRVAQVWLHHTGHNTAQSYGTKTREWEMDTVASLTKGEEAFDTPINLQFPKARLRTPDTAPQFAARLIRFVGHEWIDAGSPQTKAKQTEAEIVIAAILAAYDRLADGITPTHGFDGKAVRKVNVDSLRDEVKSRGFLDTDQKGQITAASRKTWQRAKSTLLAEHKLIEDKGLIWKA